MPGPSPVGNAHAPGSLRLTGGDLTPGMLMTINPAIDQVNGGTTNTTIRGSGGHLDATGLWYTALTTSSTPAPTGPT